MNVFRCYFESGYAVSKSRFGFADEGRDRGSLLARKISRMYRRRKVVVTPPVLTFLLCDPVDGPSL